MSKVDAMTSGNYEKDQLENVFIAAFCRGPFYRMHVVRICAGICLLRG